MVKKVSGKDTTLPSLRMNWGNDDDRILSEAFKNESGRAPNLVIILFFAHLTAENGVTVEGVSQNHWKNDDDSPEGKL